MNATLVHTYLNSLLGLCNGDSYRTTWTPHNLSKGNLKNIRDITIYHIKVRFMIDYLSFEEKINQGQENNTFNYVSVHFLAIGIGSHQNSIYSNTNKAVNRVFRGRRLAHYSNKL